MKKIIIVGTGTIDIVFNTDESIKTGQKINVRESFISLGGGALNAATTFRNLNLDYLAYFRLGRDLIGKIILEKVKKDKLKTKIFFHSGESQFSLVVIKGSERTIFVYRGLSDHFDWSELKTIAKSNFYYLTTANTYPKIFLKFIQNIKREANLISINPSKKFLLDKNSAQVLKLADIIFVNREEMVTFLGEKGDTFDMAKKIVRRINPQIFVLTLGEKGSVTFWQDKIFIADIFRPKKLTDTTGAGDAFASAFFANLVMNRNIDEKNIKKSIIWGSANASANIEELGAQKGLLLKNDFNRYRSLKIRTLLWKR